MNSASSVESSPPPPPPPGGIEPGRFRPIEQCLADLQTIKRTPSPEPKKLGDTSYTYKPLNPQGDEIRLLQILPDVSGLVCQIIHVRLDNQPGYIAISYAWGNPEDTRSITLDGHDFPVTVSLWQILERLRSEYTSVIVWADAICINQPDLNERLLQVQRMTRIYKSAKSVAAWLGPEYDDSALAADFLTKLLKTDKSDSRNCNSFITSPLWTQHLIAFAKVLRRNYWYRLWTVQELFNARHVDIYYGSTKLPFSAFTKAAHIFRRCRQSILSSFPDTIIKGVFLPGILYDGQYTVIPHRELGLSEAINITQRHLCQDPLDKIYGVLGLLRADERGCISPDYTLPKQRVYTNAVRHVIETTKNLDIICRPVNHCCTLQDRDRDGSMPTWLPDFSRPPESDVAAINIFNASRETVAAVSFFANQRKIEVRAVPIDSIKIKTSIFPATNSLQDAIVTFLRWCSVLVDISTPGESHKALEDLCHLIYTIVKYPPTYANKQNWMRVIFGTIRYFIDKLAMGVVMSQELHSLTDFDGENVFDDFGVLDLLAKTMAGRQACITTSGLLSLVSGPVQKGDDIYVLLGASVPVVLRREGTEYTYHGEAIVLGYMHGRAINEVESGRREIENIVLI